MSYSAVNGVEVRVSGRSVGPIASDSYGSAPNLAAPDVPVPREGFSGASPYEIVQQYAAGELSREQAVDELSRWEYVPMPSADPFGDLFIPDGTFEEVCRAESDGLIDGTTYEEIGRAHGERVRVELKGPTREELDRQAPELARQMLAEVRAEIRAEYGEISSPTCGSKAYCCCTHNV